MKGLRRSAIVMMLGFAVAMCCTEKVRAQKFEPIKFGDMNSWITRNIKESRVIGGNTRTVYEIGPTQTIDGDIAYTPKGGSPWATSNVMAKVMGVTKTSNAVYPADRTPGDKCARLTTILEHCKVLGLFDIKVLVSGSIFLGSMKEPISNTSNPYGKMEFGVPFTGRPKALRFDYKVVNPGTNTLTYATTGSYRTYPGQDNADVFIYLQRRWEDEKGNLYAKRVGTARNRFNRSTDWVNGYQMPIVYGDASQQPGFQSYMDLLPEDHCYYARNSKGKMVPVHEVGWDDHDAVPTHMIMMASAGSGTAFEGTVGMELWIDNVGLVY